MGIVVVIMFILMSSKFLINGLDRVYLNFKESKRFKDFLFDEDISDKQNKHIKDLANLLEELEESDRKNNKDRYR